MDYETELFIQQFVDPDTAPVLPWKRELFNGQRIYRISCLGSKYDHGRWLNVRLDHEDGEICRIDVSEFLKLLSYATFEARKKRTYRHLRIIAQEPDPDGYIFDQEALDHFREILQKSP